jgi:hypothetical protein
MNRNWDDTYVAYAVREATRRQFCPS